MPSLRDRPWGDLEAGMTALVVGPLAGAKHGTFAMNAIPAGEVIFLVEYDGTGAPVDSELDWWRILRDNGNYELIVAGVGSLLALDRH